MLKVIVAYIIILVYFCTKFFRRRMKVNLKYNLVIGMIIGLVAPTPRFEGIPDQSRQEIEVGSGDAWKYTSFFIDLIDNTNQRSTRGAGTDINFANDKVRGYTLEQIQTALNWRTNLDGITNYLREKNTNATSSGLNDVFLFYDDIRKNH